MIGSPAAHRTRRPPALGGMAPTTANPQADPAAAGAAARRDILAWEEHRRQVLLVRRWEQARAGRPFDQAAQPRPDVDSPYATGPNPPPLPDRPGQTRYLWGGLVGACALFVLVAGLATHFG